MILFKHETCWCLTLFRSKHNNIEIVFCPKGYKIQPHTHPNINIELVFLFGRAVFHRISNLTGKKSIKVEFPYSFGKHFSIAHNHKHWFEVSTLPLIFINWEKWLNGIKPTSAAVDFHKE